MEAARIRVGEHIQDFAGADALLRTLPEFCAQKILVRLEEHLLEIGPESEEADELLGEDVVLAHVEPGLRAHFVLVAVGPGDRAEAVFGEQAQLVVIVEHHAPVPRDAEILEEHVAGEDVRGREVLDGLPVVYDRGAGGGGIRVAQVQVEGGHPALGVEVAYRDPVSLDRDAARAAIQELLKKVLPEARPVEQQVLELLGVDHAPRAVVLEDQGVLVHDLPARGGLRVGEPVPDDLEHDVERGERKHHHHHAALAGGDLEELARRFQVTQQLAVELGLAVLVVADRNVELGDAFLGHDGSEKLDHLVGILDGDAEVGAREAEHDARVVRLRERGVDRDALPRMPEREHQGDDLFPRPGAPHDVGALVAVEDGLERLDGLDSPQARGAQLRVDRARGEHDVVVDILVRRAQVVETEHRAHETGRGIHPGEDVVEGDARAGGGKVEVRVDELACAVDAHGCENAARDRVEKGLGELEVARARDKAGIGGLHLRPHGGGHRCPAERFPRIGDHAVHDLPVEVQPFDGIALHAVPVAPRESFGRPRGDRAELVLEGEESLVDPLRAQARELSYGDHGRHSRQDSPRFTGPSYRLPRFILMVFAGLCFMC